MTRVLLFALCPLLSAFAQNDATWLREKGALIFHDAFEREEDGNLAKAIGNGWNSATAFCSGLMAAFSRAMC